MPVCAEAKRPGLPGQNRIAANRSFTDALWLLCIYFVTNPSKNSPAGTGCRIHSRLRPACKDGAARVARLIRQIQSSRVHKMSTALFTHPACLAHEPPEGH